eukprot:TRINITY_DN5775_c0_g1_i1.p1 TRINITY_DN5775_c0_g1~~TRINITY_DN5775_c0_g1_i1.p1  ORF type:complete len:200 (-),score=41.12 TRINITY_DN5775_c0_g1_i1:201-743(-)
MFKDTGIAKVTYVNEYLKEMLHDESMKILVFAHHKKVIQDICHMLEKEEIDHISISGETPVNKRQDFVDKFQEDPSVRVAVLGMTSAGSGLTLTAASCVVFAELFWTPGTLKQCEDRAHRIGQKQSVSVYYLIAEGTSDEYLWDMIVKKLDVLGATLNGGGMNERNGIEPNEKPTMTDPD